MTEIRCLFETKTVYDQETYRILVQLMLRKLRRLPRLAVLTLGFGTLFLAGYRLFTRADFDLICVLFLLFGNALVIFAVFAEYFLTLMLCAETGKKNPLINRYRFYPEELEISPSNGQPFRIPYSHFGRILEYKNRLFLFVDDKNAFILNPSSMTRGTEEKLRDFLNEKLAENLQKQKKKQ